MQKRIIVLMLGILLFLAGWAVGQTKAGDNNGARWKALNEFEKNLYAFGFSRGYDQGLIEGIAVGLTNMMGSTPPTFTPDQKKSAFKLAAQAQDHAALSGKSTIRQITHTMDTFYSDYRNTAVCWSDAALLSSVSLAGRAPTEASVEAARKKGAEIGCQ